MTHSTKTTDRWRAKFSTLLLTGCLALFGSLAHADQALIGQLDELLNQNQLEEAAEVGRQLDQQQDDATDVTLPLARLARALQQSGDLETAAEFYKRSVDASTRDSAAELDSQKKFLVRLAAGAVLTQVNQLSEAIATLEPTLLPEAAATDKQKEMVVTLLLRIGSTALAIGAPGIASQAFGLASEHASENQHATAMLGEAWAMAVERRDPLAAARKLASFIDRYPDHDDTHRAARACAECLKQAGRAEDASVMLADLLQRWPDSESTWEVVASHRELAIDLIPSAVKSWLLESAGNSRLEKLDVPLTVLGLQAASQEKAVEVWSNLARHLATIDQSGQPTSDLLAKFAETGRESEAERLATMMIAPIETGSVQAGPREAACRWAGRTERWSMLALASESSPIDQEDPSRTVAVERLMAESLMQVGRVEDAAAWWNHLVDTRHTTDFSTLLRCAEAETAVGSEVEKAEQRITAARTAAGTDRFQQALVDLLDAELAIRRSEFDRARGLLEQVVRVNEAEAGLRGRAQWLIGETHYLQHDFADAIEAYRRVEGIDPEGMWIAASLIQAGKSFEQLGRTREAAVCYSNLLSRFADTSHAELARRRLAAISPEANPSTESSSSPIRR